MRSSTLSSCCTSSTTSTLSRAKGDSKAEHTHGNPTIKQFCETYYAEGKDPRDLNSVIWQCRVSRAYNKSTWKIQLGMNPQFKGVLDGVCTALLKIKAEEKTGHAPPSGMEREIQDCIKILGGKMETA